MKKSVILVSVVVVVLVAAFYAHRVLDRGAKTTAPQYTGLLRSEFENQLTSPRDPGIVLKFDPSFRYIGGQKFVLYGVSDVEQHFFVKTSGNSVQSLYWVQFEAYLPDNSYTYDYSDSPAHVELNGFDFYLDTEAVHSDPSKRRRGSDGSLFRDFIRSKGYQVPEEFAYARLVHLTDESHRKELMVVFIDDLAPTGLTAPDLTGNGKAASRWPEIEKQHLEKIRTTLTLIRSVSYDSTRKP